MAGKYENKQRVRLESQPEDSAEAISRRAELERRLREESGGNAPAISPEAKKRLRVKRVRIILVAVVVVTAVAFGVWNLVLYITNPYNIRPIRGQDPNAENGTSIENAEEPVEYGFYRIVINMVPKMQAGSRACNLNIENVLGNTYTVKVTIADERGQTLYASGYIQPGQRVMDVELERELPPGDHTVTATYFLYERNPESDELEECGSTGTSITITVQP